MISFEELAKHNKPNDAWMGLKGTKSQSRVLLFRINKNDKLKLNVWKVGCMI
jgi:hypothetical protein